MIHVEARLRGWFARRTPAIKLLSFAILAGLAWPLPPMVAFSNPAEAVFLGRYDQLYFTMLAGYAALALGWAVLSGWLVLHLDGDRLDRSRQWACQHAGRIVSGLGLAALLGWFVAVAVEWQVWAIPGDVYVRLRLVPPICLVLIGLGIVTGWGDVLQAGLQESDRFKWAMFSSRQYNWLVAAGLMGLTGWLLLQRGLLTTALIKDASVHLYIGQHMLRGGIPYQTVIYFHPPLRFLISALWALPGAAGLPPVGSARVVYGLMALGIVWLVYGIGKQLSGQVSGGVLAAGLMMHTPFLTTTVFEGPNLKIAVALALTISVWLAQRNRWFWAGAASAMGIGLWLPAVGGALGLGMTALLIGDIRWRTTRDVLLGGLLVSGLVGGWMMAAGTMGAFIQQSLLAALTVTGSEGGGGRLLAVWQDFLNLPNLLNGWALAAAAGIGLLLVLGRRRRDTEARSTWLTPIAVCGALFLVMSQDVLLGLDFIALGSLLTGLAAVAVLAVTDLTPAPTAGRWAAAGLITLSLVAMGMVTTLSNKFDREPQPLSLAEQQRMAADLAATLLPDDTVQAFDLMWFMVLTGRDNSLPILQARPKGRAANEEAGWPETVILEALKRTQPAVVMLEAGSQVDMGLLREQYLYAGAFDMSTVRPQHVYIRQDRQEIQAILKDWPESNP